MSVIQVVHTYNPEKRAGEVIIGDFVIASTDYAVVIALKKLKKDIKSSKE